MDPSDLYGLPFERFITERDALARRLRTEGKREEATRVSRLRKPSLAAWAVNQLVRTQRRDVDRLFKAGDALQKAQADLLKGRGDPTKLRRAVEAERGATEKLLARAAGLLSSDGNELTPARLEQVSETLHAAALDDDARGRVKDGCLERELRHVGLGAMTGTVTAAPSRRTEPKQSAPADAARREARQTEARARREMERTAKALQTAQERRDRAADHLRDADEQLAAARQLAEAAIDAHRRAADAVETYGRASRSRE
jgi:hypothetical protein